ncbi:MAG: hypothetical protein GY851_08275 [bacterium]|nr:hypothetical protein [bacterium]
MSTVESTKVDEGRDSGELAVHLDERIARLRSAVMSRHGSWTPDANPFERDVALWRAWQPGQSVVQTRAALLLQLVQQAPVAILPDWRLAGNHLPGHAFGFCAPPEDRVPARLEAFHLAEDEVAEVQRCVERWARQREQCAMVGVAAEEAPRVPSVYTGGGWIENHSIRDYAKVLRIGFDEIRTEVDAAAGDADLADPDYARKESFWRAARWVCEAGSALGARYAEHAASLGRETDEPAERARLEAMADRCRRVPAQGARTLEEAVQSLWLAHILTCGEDGINANSIGRLDQMLYPYYAADVEAGRATRDDAVRLMEELACRLYLDYDVQAITLGGQTADGHDAANEMSYIIIEASRNVGFVRDLSVRLHRGSPDRLVDASAELIARGGGIPFVFNDDCFVPALSERGIALEDARDYAPIGCIELTVPGRANPHAVSGWFNAAKCFELALFDGVDPGCGDRLGPATGLLTDFQSFDDLLAAYESQVEHFASHMVYHCNRGESAQRERGPLPCWSVLTDDCIARGRDITDGGAVYNYHSVCFLGTANTADGLAALRTLVFEERTVDARTVLDALRTDFDGHESLRKRLLGAAPKYGNDQPEVDALAAHISNHFIDVMDEARSPLGGRYFVHLFSFLLNIDYGKQTGALPDGRRAGEPLAYSLSAHQGRDQDGVTAMLNSLACLPHRRAAGATAAIVDLDPAFIRGEEGVHRLAQIVRTAIRMGVGQLQFNVTTADRLRKAQDDPERYGNIPVRVAGYSQMFRLLTKELQDHVIARTKHVR